MAEEVPLETKVRIEALVREIAKKNYPAVLVVEDGSEDEDFAWNFEKHEWSEWDWIESARQRGVSVIGGLDVVQKLRGEMDSADEEALRDRVMHILAAKLGMVVVDDDDPYRPGVKGKLGVASGVVKMVPVEEVSLRETEGWMFFEMLELMARERERRNAFTVAPTAKVLMYLEEHGEYGS